MMNSYQTKAHVLITIDASSPADQTPNVKGVKVPAFVVR